MDNFYRPELGGRIRMMENALKAKELFVRDRDYIVAGGEVQIVDVSTGRVLEGAASTTACTRRSKPRRVSRFNPKTRRPRRSPRRTTSVSTSGFRHDGDRPLSRTGVPADLRPGGSADPRSQTAAANRSQRQDIPHHRAKLEAVAESGPTGTERGQPVLIGTVSVEKSEQLSDVP